MDGIEAKCEAIAGDNAQNGQIISHQTNQSLLLNPI